MAKEWGFDGPIPRGYFSKAEHFPPDFVVRAEARLKTAGIDSRERASIRYELGRYRFMVDNDPTAAAYDFGKARDASGCHPTLDADARRWISRCLQRVGETAIDAQSRTLSTLLNASEETDLEGAYRESGDMAGLGFMVLDHLDRQLKLHCLNLYACVSNPVGLKEDFRTLKECVTAADVFLAELDRSGSDSSELWEIRQQIEDQRKRTKLYIEFTERLAKS